MAATARGHSVRSRGWEAIQRHVDGRLVGVAVRLLAVAAAVVATSAVRLPGRPPTLCVLRAVTGLPCPFCGGTTAAVHLGHGDLGGALTASPAAVLILAALPFLGVLPRPRWWEHRAARLTTLVVALMASELWQLGRFGLLGGHAA